MQGTDDPLKAKSARVWAEVRRIEEARASEAVVRAEAERLQREEDERVAALVKEAGDWRNSTSIRDYVAAVALAKGPTWAAWARETVERLSGSAGSRLADMPTMREPPCASWLEFLDKTELAELTGCKRAEAQHAWLSTQGVPCKRDGRRVIVSRFHVREWLRGGAPVSEGPNWAAMNQ